VWSDPLPHPLQPTEENIYLASYYILHSRPRADSKSLKELDKVILLNPACPGDRFCSNLQRICTYIGKNGIAFLCFIFKMKTKEDIHS
jgi:hypothetical protein